MQPLNMRSTIVAYIASFTDIITDLFWGEIWV